MPSLLGTAPRPRAAPQALSAPTALTVKIAPAPIPQATFGSAPAANEPPPQLPTATPARAAAWATLGGMPRDEAKARLVDLLVRCRGGLFGQRGALSR